MLQSTSSRQDVVKGPNSSENKGTLGIFGPPRQDKEKPTPCADIPLQWPEYHGQEKTAGKAILKTTPAIFAPMTHVIHICAKFRAVPLNPIFRIRRPEPYFPGAGPFKTDRGRV